MTTMTTASFALRARSSPSSNDQNRNSAARGRRRKGPLGRSVSTAANVGPHFGLDTKTSKKQQKLCRRSSSSIITTTLTTTSNSTSNSALIRASSATSRKKITTTNRTSNEIQLLRSSGGAGAGGGGAFDGFDTGTQINAEDEEKLKQMSLEIKDWLKLLYVKREMSFNEVKLIIGIEDPRLADRRERFGVEDESGCSAEEKIRVLECVDEGRTPTDIVACEFVLNELREWPGLDSDEVLPERRGEPSKYEEIAMDAAGIKGGRTRNPKRMLDEYMEDDGEKKEEKNILGFLPLYAVSSAPIFITIFALGIMFVNSLQ